MSFFSDYSSFKGRGGQCQVASVSMSLSPRPQRRRFAKQFSTGRARTFPRLQKRNENTMLMINRSTIRNAQSAIIP